jgi:diguanylate cyclase (GGDEF)-like protein
MIMNTELRSFEQSSKDVLSFLHDRLGFNLWMVTRTEGNDWIVLHSEDHGYQVKAGDVFKWTDSFCSQMVQGNGPCIAPKSEHIPAYAAAPIGRVVDIKAYIGVPLTQENGALFGTLCAIDPEVQPDTLREEQPLVELMAKLLSRLLQAELRLESETRRAKRLEIEALTDSLTNVYNRRAWDQLIETEEDHCRRFGHPACILIVDTDNLKRVNDTQGHAAGDTLLKTVADTLKTLIRPSDAIARLGGDEFGIICVECHLYSAQLLKTNIQTQLASRNISASIGVAMRNPSLGLADAMLRADEDMYREKKEHHAQP